MSHSSQQSTGNCPSPSPPLVRHLSADVVLRVVQALYAQLHRSELQPIAIDLDSHLERDLGFDSLARVELLSRLEQQCGIRLREGALERTERVRDILRVEVTSRDTPRSQTQLAKVDVRPAPVSRSGLACPNAAPTEAATLNEVLEWHLQQHPDSAHAILLGDEEPRTLTYADLWNAARSIGGGLQQAGIRNGATVALMLPTSAEYLYTFFGVLLVGAAPVPIYPPTRPSQLEEHVHRNAGILANAGVQALITFRETRNVANLLRTRVPSLRHIWSVAELRDRGAYCSTQPTVTAESLGMLQYTSGSTGSPKGVILTHGNLLANIRAIGTAAGANATDVFVSWLPLYHDMGLIGGWLGSLYFGCLFVLMPPTTFLARPQRWLRAIQQYGGTLSASPNFGYELCARRLADSDLDGLDLSSWRLAFNGAEPVFPETLERFKQRFAPFGFRPEAMTPVYGLAEAALALSFPPAGRGPLIDVVDREQLAQSERAVPVPPDVARALRFVACGRPLPGYQLRVVDRSEAEVPERTEGAVQFAGPSATAGYFRNAGATARLLRGEWRDTGDEGYMAGGEVYITGRLKDLIIRRGRHIYPEEIESAVAELEGIRKGCVAAFGTKEPSTATEKLVVLAETRHTEPELQAQLRARIIECVIECIGEPPEEVILARPHSVLKTSSGKLRRAATRAAYEKRDLGRAPASPALQVLRLTLESARLTLRRWRQASSRVAYGVYAWLAFFAVAAPLGIVILFSPTREASWHRCHRAARRVIRAWRIPFSCNWGATIDLSAPHVMVINHCSYVDSIFVAALLPDPHVFVAKAELQRSPLVRTWLRKIGTLFVDRSASVQSAPEVEGMKTELTAGSSLVVFPEGTFTRIDGLRPFHLGAFEAAVAAGAAVIPVALRGTRSMLRDGQRLPRRVPVRATVGSPLSSHGDCDAFAAAVELRDAAREQILRACGDPELRPDHGRHARTNSYSREHAEGALSSGRCTPQQAQIAGELYQREPVGRRPK